MEYAGLFGYKVNRPLTEEEKELKLSPHDRQASNPFYQLSVIKMNSSYLDLVDKYYAWKGLLTFATSIVFLGIVLFLSALFISLLSPNEQQIRTGLATMWLTLLLMTATASPLAIVCIWLLRKESFRWTHYPIRLNRKNRMVYVFRLDGTVLSVPWKEVFFTLGRGGKSMGIESWDVRGHVLDKDRKTVLETFSFGYVTTSVEGVQAHWEYFRRYMEEGPREPWELLNYCLPIDQHKEPSILGLQKLWLVMHGQIFFQILLSPIFLMAWIGRQFAMATCKTPVWPIEVEEACTIEPGDPYVKDGRTNPPDAGLWFP
ncbi:DUF6708 domain-containing protein [Holophaga foetida]|uniref:DUF6708 domain-containing protein n=1 Tax=Holophaga foetida TaxID=35839 RepID=UPI0002471D0F|nr:DUF6708 domain-containing protein [Holophaga foetida]